MTEELHEAITRVEEKLLEIKRRTTTCWVCKEKFLLPKSVDPELTIGYACPKCVEVLFSNDP